MEAAFRTAVEEGRDAAADDNGDDGRGSGGGTGTDGARSLTIEDRADLWEWYEEFVEDSSMDIAKVRIVCTVARKEDSALIDSPPQAPHL